METEYDEGMLEMVPELAYNKLHFYNQSRHLIVTACVYNSVYKIRHV